MSDRPSGGETKNLAGFVMNRGVAWASMVVGVATGLILGLWSFAGPVPVPAWLGEYGDVARRLARLGHIACFGLAILNLLMVGELSRSVLSRRSIRLAAWCMNFGNIFLPATLFLAAAWHPLKYLMSIPALSVGVAMAITAGGVWRGPREGELRNG